MGSGSYGRVVASNTRGPWFESSNMQNFIQNIFPFEKTKVDKNGRERPFKEKLQKYLQNIGLCSFHTSFLPKYLIRHLPGTGEMLEWISDIGFRQVGMQDGWMVPQIINGEKFSLPTFEAYQSVQKFRFMKKTDKKNCRLSKLDRFVKKINVSSQWSGRPWWLSTLMIQFEFH